MISVVGEFIQEDGIYIDDVMLMASNVTPPALASASHLPQCFELADPYPNPFNGRLTVPFNLPEEGLVKLSLYDISGRFVLEGVPAVFPAGSNVMTINADALTSGIYFLKGISPSGNDTKKVMLIK